MTARDRPFADRVFYATRAGTPERAIEEARFERLGLLGSELKPIEAFCLAQTFPRRL